MKIIAGLGNPGMEYAHTRHNAGFNVINMFAKKHNFSFSKKGNMYISENNVLGEKIILVKPLTFMNLSGEAVSLAADRFKCPAEDIMVIYDDMDLPCGKLRIRARGSAGGHNGIKSVIACLGTEEFSRMRIGIGRKGGAVDFVLGKFSKEENAVLSETYSKACDALDFWLENGAEKTMNEFNGN